MLSSQITTFTQGMPRSYHKQAFLSHGSQLWSLPWAHILLIQNNRETAANGLVVREVITLKMVTLMKVDRSHGKFRIEDNKSDGKNPYRASSTVCNFPCNNIFSLCTALVDHNIACKKHKQLASFSLMLAQYHFIFIFATQFQ